MRIINSSDLNPPGGHYSHAVLAGGMIYVSGQLPFALGSKVLPEGARAQTIQTLKNVKAVLHASGAQLKQLVSVQIIVSDINLWPEVNEAYSEFLGDHKPARTVIPCAGLHYGALVEITAIAEASGPGNN